MYLFCDDFPNSIFEVYKENISEIIEKNGKLIKIPSSKEENKGKFSFFELRKLQKTEKKHYLLEIKGIPYMMDEIQIDDEKELDGMTVFHKKNFIQYKKCYCENIRVTSDNQLLKIEFLEDIDFEKIEIEVNGQRRKIDINSIEKARIARREKLEAEYEVNKEKIKEMIQAEKNISLAEIARRIGKSKNYFYNNKKYRDLIEKIKNNDVK